MSLLGRTCFVATLALTLAGPAAVHGQTIVEYGLKTSNSAATVAPVKPPNPAIKLPDGSSNSSSHSTATFVPSVSPEIAAKTNRQYFQDHAGPNAAHISVHSTPDHASAWIDGRFVGATPVDLNVAPGHHQLLVRAPNMQESMRDVDLTAKQVESVEFPLKPGYQNQIIIQWPAHK